MSLPTRQSPPCIKDTESLSGDLGAGLLFDELTSDVTLNVQGESFPAHRALLAARSPVFRAMLFAVPMRECSAKAIEVKTFAASTMRQLLSYIYTGVVERACSEDMVRLLACADHYVMPSLQDAIANLLADAISVENACELLICASANHQDNMIQRCTAFITECAQQVVNTDGFLKLDANILKTLLEADDMCIEEFDLFRALARWYRNLSFVDTKQVELLFARIRYGRLSGEELFTAVKPLVGEIVPLNLYTSAVEQAAAPGASHPRAVAVISISSGDSHEVAEMKLDPTATSCWLCGRNQSCDVLLSGAGTSGRHAQIVRNDGLWFIQDLGSSNGTYLEGKRIAPQEMVQWRVGARVTFRMRKSPDTLVLREQWPGVPPRFSTPRGKKRPRGTI